MIKKDDGPRMLGRPTLKTRGWTEGLIGQFLGEPDKLAPNPHYRGSPPRKLWLEDRVIAVEGSPLFGLAKRKAQRRQDASAKAHATKRMLMGRLVDAIEIKVPVLEPADLAERACRHYNWRRSDREDRAWASPDSDRRFLDRISVNYLRHRLTDYERHLDRTGGKVGARTACAEIKRKVLAAIGAAYPELAHECERQMTAAVGAVR